MKNLRNLFKGAKGRYATPTAKGTFLSLLLTTCAAFTACTNEVENISQESKAALQLKVGVNQPTSRAIVEGKALPNESQIGVSVVDNTGTAYQNQNYNNVLYTAAEVQGKQTWSTTANVTLSGEEATLYAYYPYAEGADITAIPVDMTETDQKDWMYATPVTGLSDGKSTAEVQLNHALTDLRLTFYKDTYSGAGEVTEFTIQSTGLATGGTLNAKTGEITVPATPVNTITRTAAFTLTDKASATPLDVMLIPTGTEAPVTVSVTVDGNTYSASTAAFTLQKAKAYNYVMKLTSTGLEVTSVALTDWNEEALSDATFEPENNNTSGPWASVPDGVYAVGADGKPVSSDKADETCIGAALVLNSGVQPCVIMIEKNGVDKLMAWDYNRTDISLPAYDYNHYRVMRISEDYTSWVNSKVSLTDFKGAENTEVIKTLTGHEKNMGTVLNSFLADDEKSLGFDDWYIPASGHMALIYLNLAEINETLNKIKGNPIDTSFSGWYWSSTHIEENNDYYGQQINLITGVISYLDKASPHCCVRFIRDLVKEQEPRIIKFYINEEEYQAKQGMLWEEWVESEYNIDHKYYKQYGDYITQRTELTESEMLTGNYTKVKKSSGGDSEYSYYYIVDGQHYVYE